MKKLISLFLSVLLCLNIFSGMAFAVPVADADDETVLSTEATEFNGTQDLIQQTIKELIEAGKIVTDVDKPSDAFIEKIEECSGLTFDTVKTEIATALSENREEGKIDVSRFNLSRNDAAEMMEWVLKDFYLVQAVTDIKYVTDASGMAVSIRYTMSDGMSAALDEMQEEQEYFEENYDVAEVEDVVEEVILESVEKTDFLAAVAVAEENGLIALAAEDFSDFGEADEGVAETTTVEPTTAETTTAEPTTAETTTAETTTAEPTTEPTTVAPAPACQLHTVGYGFDEASQQYYALVNATWEMVKTVGELAADYSNAELVFDPETGAVSVSAPINISYTCTAVAFQCAVCNEVVNYTYDPAYGENNVITNVGEQTIYYDLRTGEAVTERPSGTENVDWVNYTNYAIAVFPHDQSFDATGNIDPNAMVTVMLDAGQERVKYYYSQMSSFNALNADLFGISAPYWTSKNTESNPMAAVKVLCNLDPNQDIPPNSMIQMVQMLPQAFMSYVMNYESQLLAMKDLAMAELKKLPSNATDVQKLLVLHDWLAEHATFDMGSLNDAANASNDPIQMTTFGAVLSLTGALGSNYYGGVCLSYAAAYTWLVQWAFSSQYQNNGKFLAADKANHIIDFVQIKFFADTNETSVAGAGFGGGYFNNVHYFNAVKLDDPTTGSAKDDWFYVDVCYDDISVECISQYRVEADGNLSHMNFLTSPQTIESLYKSSTDYIDSLYDGYTYVLTDTPSTDSNGNILTNSDGSIHYEYEKVTNPNETAYNNACYEDSWFSGAVSPIEFDGTNWYYVDSGNTYVAYKDYIDEEGDFDIGNMGGGDYDMGDIMHDNRVDPANADKLKVRAISAPDYYTSNSQGGGMMGQSEKTDPYAEVLIKYGFGHVATNVPELLSKAGDKNVDAVYDGQAEGDSNNDYTGMTGMILDECQKDFAMNELYPGLVHTVSLYNNVLYFNLANKIMTLDLSTGEISQLKEYNDVYATKIAGHNFTGASYRIAEAGSSGIVFTAKNRPLASFAIRDNVGSDGSVTPTIVVAIATNLAYSYPAKAGSDSEFDSYTKEASNFNPDFQRGVSGDNANDNSEFLWCANIREEMNLSEVLAEYATLADVSEENENLVSVTVDAWCDEAEFTELRTAKYGLSDGSTKEYFGEAAVHHYEKNEDNVFVCRHCLSDDEDLTSVDNSGIYDVEFTWEENTCTSATAVCYYDECTLSDKELAIDPASIVTVVGENTCTATVTLDNGMTFIGYKVINPGDVNGDDKINVIDVIALKAYLGGDKAAAHRVLADLNNDRTISADDLAVLYSIIAEVSADAGAEESDLRIVLTADADSIMADESGAATFDVYVSIEGVSEENSVSVMDISFSYDDSVIALKSVADGSLMTVANNTENSLLLETADHKVNLAEDGVLATLTFEFLGEVTDVTDIALLAKVDSAAKYTTDFELVDITGTSTDVSVKPHCPHTETTLVNVVEVTCTENGYTGDKQCNECGLIVENGEEIVAEGHVAEDVPETPATCTETGLSAGVKCSVCEFMIEEQTVIDALGHTEVAAEYVAPTCTEDGYEAGTNCSVCNEILDGRAVIPALGHSWKEATCTDAKTCTVCSATEGDALGHNIVVDAAVAATCTATGLTEGSHCSRCDYVAVAQETIPATGHTEAADAAVAATCTETGLTEGSHCSVCNEVLVAQEETPALGHNIVTDAYKAPTCTEIGYESGSHCTRCDDMTVMQEEIAALGHDIVVDAAVAATCTQTGLTEGQHCSRCDDETVAQEVTPVLDHNVETVNMQEATCTENGYTGDKICTVCNGTVENGEAIPATGHTDEVITGTAATCTETGLTDGVKCAVCDVVTTEQTTIDALGHTEEKVAGKDATCTETGLTEGKKCSVCNTVIEAQDEIAILGHLEEVVTGKAATCTEAGITDGKKCSRCDITIVAQEEIAVLGHLDVIDEAVAATCTQTGLTEGKHCSRCNETLVAQTETAALGHQPETANKADATCTTDGYTGDSVCTVCNETLSTGETIDAPGHTEVTDAAVAATCTTSGLTEGKHCSVCEAVITAQEVIAAAGHIESIDSYVAPTCTATGLSEGSHCLTCNVTLKAQETIDALGHAQVDDAAVAATCTQAGLTAGSHCSRCNEVFVAQESIPMLEHTTAVVNALNATCTENGYTGDTACTVCGTTIENGEAIPALGHTEEVVAGKAATCTETGLTEGKKCTVCNVDTVAQTEIAVLGHDIVVDEAVAATCTQTGLTEGQHCSRCDDETVAQTTVEALGHDIIVDEAVAETCTTPGLTEGQHCSRCDDATVAQEEIPAPGHTEEVVAGKAATCTEAGITDGKKCTVCGTVTVEQETIDAPGHTEEVVAGKAATCTEAGITDGKKCTVCDAVTVEQVTIDALGHTEEVVAGKAATCTETGLTEGKKCSVCDFVIDEQEILDALGHDMLVDAYKAPTCTAEGFERGEYCSRCDRVDSAHDMIPALGHDIVIDEAVDATCTETGLTAGQHCSRCDDETIAQDTIPALGHTEETINAIAETCTQNGYTGDVICTVCDATVVNGIVIPAAGHVEVTVSGEAATCTKTGLTEGKVCAVCDEVTVAQQIIEKTAHTEVTVAGKTATCTKTGLTDGKVCSACDKVIVAQKTIAKTGHKFSAWTQTKVATFTAEGSEVRTCSNCDAKETREIAKLSVSDSTIKVNTESGKVSMTADKKVSDLAKSINSDNIIVVDNTGKELSSKALVGTGAKIQVTDNSGKVIEKFTVVVASDVDGNGTITAADARLALRYSARLEKLEGVYATAADVTADNKITAADARKILRISAGLEK